MMAGTRRCHCEVCKTTERIRRLSTTRWVRKRTVQRELAGLYEVYFDVAEERDMLDAYIAESRKTDVG